MLNEDLTGSEWRTANRAIPDRMAGLGSPEFERREAHKSESTRNTLSTQILKKKISLEIFNLA